MKSRILRVLISTLLFLVLLNFCLPSQAAVSKSILIVFVRSGDDMVYQDVARSFSNRLAGLGDGQRWRYKNIHVDDYDTFLRQNSSPALVVTIGTAAANQVVGSRSQLPVVCTLLTKAAFELALHGQSRNKSQNTAVAIYLDQPVLRQLTLANRLFPRLHRMGTIVSPSFIKQNGNLKAMSTKLGITLNIITADDTNNIADKFSEAIQNDQAIVAFPDPNVLTPHTAKWLLYMAYQAHVPVLGFSPAYTNAGAIAAVYSTPAQIGRQAAEKVYPWLRDRSSSLTSSYPKYFQVAFNPSVARTFGVELPDKKTLIHQLKALEIAHE